MRTPWAIGAVALLLSAGAGGLAVADGESAPISESVFGLVVVASFAVAGATILTRLPGHVVGRLLSAFGLLLAINLFGARYAASTPELPGREWVAWLGGVIGGPAIVLVPVLLLVFPDGELPSPRWRPMLWLAAAAGGAIAVGFAVSRPVEAGLDNPLGLELSEASPLYQGGIGWGLFPLLLLAAAASLIVRFRRANSEERLQLRWLAVAGVLAAPGWLLTAASWEDPALLSTALTGATTLAVPVAIGVAVLRYRLFDLDLVIRRSLVYAVLWLFLGGLYVAVSAAIGIAAGRRLPVEVAILLTILATLVFQPAHARLDRLASRLVFGKRHSRYEVLTQLGETLENSLDVGELAPRVADTVRQGLDVQWVRVLLSLDAGRLQPAGASGIGLEAHAEPAFAVPLVHADEPLGAIECGPKAEGELTEADRRLLANLARQAALGIRSARLAAELSARLDEIRRQAAELEASRTRILQAQDAERRRLERDLHDGAQQHLVSLLAKLQLARNALRREPEAAADTLAEMQSEARQLLHDLRELAQGIHPAVLSDRGLLEAIESRTTRFPLPAEIVADPGLRGTRFAPDVEAAAYFFTSEALANVIKHARASVVTITLVVADGRLCVTVVDDGIGLSGRGEGSGLLGLRDRLEGLGGRLHVTSGPGTRLEADLPVTERVHA